MTDQRVRDITDGEVLIAQVFDFSQAGPVIFPTPDTAEMQCGFGQSDAARTVPPHIHNVLHRSIENTSEFILVFAGKMDVVFLNATGAELTRATIGPEQGFLQYTCGHLIEIAAGTRYVEVKQGPYMGHTLDKTVLTAVGGSPV